MAAFADAVEEFRDAAFSDGYVAPSDLPKSAGAAKRKAPEPSPAVAEEWREYCRSNKIAKMTIPEIKEFLSEHGQRVGGKKADLIERVREFLHVT